MLENWVNLYAFRNVLSDKEKFFLVIFDIIITILLLAGKIVILGLKIIAGIIGALIGSK